VDAAAYFPDGRHLLTSGGGQIRVQEVATGRLRYAIRADTATVTPDGRTLLTVARETLSVRDAETGRELSRWEGARGTSKFSPDARLAVFWDDDTSTAPLRVHDAQTGRLIHTLREHVALRELVTTVVFSADSLMLASTGAKPLPGEITWNKSLPGRIKLWNLKTGRFVHDLSGLESYGLSISFSPDGTRIAACGRDSTARVWDTATGRLLHTLRGHSNRVDRVVFSPNGRRIATRGIDYSVRVWDATTGQELFVLDDQREQWQGPDASALSDSRRRRRARLGPVLRFSPDSRRLLTVINDTSQSKPGELRLYDADDGREYLRLRGATYDSQAGSERDRDLEVHTAPILTAEFSPDGTRIVSGGMDGKARIWDARPPGLDDAPSDSPPGVSSLWTPMPNGAGGFTLFVHSVSVRDVAFRPGGGQLVSIGADGMLVLHDATKGRLVPIMILQSMNPQGMAFHPDGTEVAVAANAGKLALKKLDGASVRWLMDPSETYDLYDVAYSPDGMLLASGGRSRVVHLWDAVAAKRLRVLAGHADEIWGLAFRPGGKQLASASKDKTVKIWSLESYQVVQSLPHPAEVTDLAYSTDGTRLATACWDKLVRLFDAETGELIRTFKGLAENATLGGYSPEGRRLADNATKVRFSPDGQRLVSGGPDDTVRVWNVETGELLATYAEHSDNITGIAFSSDGAWLASSSFDGTVEVRRLPPATP
jgi:WD40 repeat protein